MSDITPLKAAEPIIFGVVKLVWKDGFAAVADLRPLIAQGEIFEFLREKPQRFDALQLEQHGHYIYWNDDTGDEIELGSDALRQRAIRQAEILRLAS